MKKLTLLSFALLVSCHTTEPKKLKIWDQGYPKSAAELKTEDEKRKEFNKFAIEENSGSMWERKSNFGVYSEESFTPVVKNVSPKTEHKFEEVHQLRKGSQIALSIAIAGLFMNAGSGDKYKWVGSSLWSLGVGASFGLFFAADSTMSEIRTEYMEGLNKRIYGNEKTTSNIGESKGYTVGFAFGL